MMVKSQSEIIEEREKTFLEKYEIKLRKNFFEQYENLPPMSDSVFRDFKPETHRWHQRMRWWVRAKTLDQWRDWLHRDCD